MTIRIWMICLLIMCLREVQGQYVYFNDIYSMDHPESTAAVEVMADGYVTVSALNMGGLRHVLMRKYDWEGDELMSNSIPVDSGYFYYHGHSALCKSGDTSLLYSGLFETINGTYSKVFLFDNNLDTVWTRKIEIEGLPLVDLTVCLSQADGYMFFGYAQYDIDRDIICVKLNTSGEYQWHWVLEDSAKSNTPFNAIQLNESEFLLGGIVVNSQNLRNNWISRLTMSGSVIWYHESGSSSRSDGGVGPIGKNSSEKYLLAYVEGVSGDPDFPESKLKIVEFEDTDQWTESATHEYSTYWRHGGVKLLIHPDDSRLIFAGYYDNQDNVHSYLQKTHDDGSEDWMNFYSYNDCSNCSNELGDVEFAPDGGYICAGYFIDYSESIPINKTWLLKIDACGDVVYNGCPPSVNVAESNAKDQHLVLWPNPALDVLHLDADPGVEVVGFSMIDIAGKRVLYHAISHFTGTYAVDVSALPAGYYLAETTLANGMSSVCHVVLSGSGR